jgi:hypothetical protein
MDTERWKIATEVAAIRGRGWVRLLVRLVGLAIVIAGGLNLLLAESILPVVIYRGLWVDAVGGSAWPLADVVAIAVGAAIAHFL